MRSDTVDHKIKIEEDLSKTSRLSNLNSIPVRTWSRLGVNDISVDEVLQDGSVKYPLVLPRQKKENRLASFTAMSGEVSENSLWKSFSYEGVGRKASTQVLEQYNTGFYLETKPGEKGTDPVRINYFLEEGMPVIDNNAILVKAGSEVTIIVDYESRDGRKGFHNGLTRIYCEKDAILNYIVIQKLSDESTHLGACAAKLEENAGINYILVELGAKYGVTNVQADLQGKQSEANLHTVYLGDKDRVIDMNYRINHYGRETRSGIEAKGILLDRCNKIFKGTIDFKKGAVKAVGEEEEYAVLLSDEVRNRSVPILLCTEEDVSGQHAASAGKIDKNRLFYLMTRGFSEAEARRLIIEAAIRPMIDRIPERSIQAAVYEEIRRKLRNEQ